MEAGAAGVSAEAGGAVWDAAVAGATDGSMDSDEGDEAGPKSTSVPGTPGTARAARAAPALGDDGKERATADGNESPVAATDENDLLLWRIRSRNEGRALSRGRSPGCMHSA